jgi:putative glycerol-1-phosphate prenyltransferase
MDKQLKNQIYNYIVSKNSRKLAILIDPGKQNDESLSETIKIADQARVDFILVGGSLVTKYIHDVVNIIKNSTNIPVILFPGNLMQLSDNADGILLLSLISGRNPDYLIGNHVLAASYLKNSGLEIIPTGYILIGTQYTSSVEYISNTKPIPADKPELIVATAIAGELMGNKIIYLEAGSGSCSRVKRDIIAEVKRNISVPLVVGGGVRTREDMKDIYEAGADIIVIGSAIEENPAMIKTFAEVAWLF